MIVTLTPNPSVDRTIEVDELVRGAVLRAVASHVDPGGKGVNVARALAANGHKVRANVSVVEPDGTVTKLNEPGPALSPAELEAVVTATVAAANDADWLAVSGSPPPATPVEFYARLIELLRQCGRRVAVDTSGPPLVAALGARPDVVKPNREELAEAAGRPVATIGDAVAAAGELCRRGAMAVLASLGADGALLVDRGGAVHGEAPVARPRSAVGAGDATLAGFLAGGGSGSFITEGAIPFAAADPLRVIPSLMAGSAVTGALSMSFGATSRAPHGGIWVIGLIGRPLLYLVALVAGVLVTAACVVLAKSTGRKAPAETEAAAAPSQTAVAAG
jgi:1-phosphofructokinase